MVRVVKGCRSPEMTRPATECHGPPVVTTHPHHHHQPCEELEEAWYMTVIEHTVRSKGTVTLTVWD